MTFCRAPRDLPFVIAPPEEPRQCSTLGVLALMGMIARNSVILFNQIEEDKAKGLHPWDAVIEAASHRVRPILLTASAAILGMIPIAPTVFWGPMAYAIMGGLAVATALTLVFLPARLRRLVPHQETAVRRLGKTSRRTSRRSPSPCWKRQPESDVSRRRHQEKAPRRRGAAPTPGHTRTPEAICLIDPAILSPLSALLGALIGGSAPVVAAIYTQRSQNHVQRIAAEVAKRETVYADFVASASTLILNAYTHDDITLGGEQQRIIGLINRMRLFAPPDVIKGADAVVRTIVDISLKPSVELRQLAQEALSRSLDPDPLLAFSVTCRADLDDVLRTMV